MPDDRFLHRRAGRSDKVTSLPDLDYRVWTQYILSADDFGVMRASPLTLQDDNDRLARLPARKVQACIDRLVTVGLLHTFEHQGRTYLFQHDWQSWQKVEYPRATNEPLPHEAARAVCDEPTRRLFGIHPGGGRRKRPEDVPNISQTFPEDVPTMRAGAPAKRLTANGKRLTANGSEGGLGETVEAPPMDRWFVALREDYPQNRVTGGHMTERAFCEALSTASDGPRSAWDRMRANLENQKRGYDWRVKGMVPKLENWLRTGAWEQRHDEEAPAADQLSAKTNRTAAAFAKIMKDGAS